MGRIGQKDFMVILLILENKDWKVEYLWKTLFFHIVFCSVNFKFKAYEQRTVFHLNVNIIIIVLIKFQVSMVKMEIKGPEVLD